MQLTLYVRRDCHLCAEMHRELMDLGGRLSVTVELVDIDSDPELVARYADSQHAPAIYSGLGIGFGLTLFALAAALRGRLADRRAVA